MTPSRERRRVQRIKFKQPVAGHISNGQLQILDLSVGGVRCEHFYPLTSGKQVRLDFQWMGEKISLKCDVVRCRLQRSETAGRLIYFSGLRFLDPEEIKQSALRKVLADVLARELREKRSPASLIEG